VKLDPSSRRMRRNLELASAKRRRGDYRRLEGVVEQLCHELVRARAPAVRVAALVLEAPAAARALVWGGQRGAELSGVAVAVALRAMGRAAFGPFGVGVATLGLTWLVARRALGGERQRVRSQLDHLRREFVILRQRWLDGSLSREARDDAVDLLIDQAALALTEAAGQEPMPGRTGDDG